MAFNDHTVNYNCPTCSTWQIQNFTSRKGANQSRAKLPPLLPHVFVTANHQSAATFTKTSSMLISKQSKQSASLHPSAFHEYHRSSPVIASVMAISSRWKPSTRREAVLACCCAGIISRVHGVWRATCAFQDCKILCLSLSDSFEFTTDTILRDFWERFRREDDHDRVLTHAVP